MRRLIKQRSESPEDSTQLSSLVKFRNELVELSHAQNLKSQVINELARFKTLHDNYPNIAYTEQYSNLTNTYNDAIKSARTARTEVSNWINQINADIDSLSQTFPSDFSADNPFVGFNFLDHIPDERLITIANKIHRYCSWQYPALQIGCKSKFWTDYMVAADPLYLTNQHADTIHDVVKNYTPEYQNRLRVYEIPIEQLTSKLPLKQFSFILAWEILNFATYNELLSVLTQAYYLLRPGGVVMFSYNNCDIDTSAHLFEIQAMSFVQQAKLTKDVQKIGFSPVAFENCLTGDPLCTHISWCELRKPGTLSTVKAHQAMGQILGK
jgi:hypothetical protein